MRVNYDRSLAASRFAFATAIAMLVACSALGEPGQQESSNMEVLPEKVLSVEGQRSVRTLLNLSNNGHGMRLTGSMKDDEIAEHNKRADKMLAEFNAELDRLATFAGEETVEQLKRLAGQRIEYNLTVIAHSRRDGKEEYEKTWNALGLSATEGLRLPSERRPKISVRPELLDEKHRVFWEYALLAPWAGRIQALNEGGQIPISALGGIRSDASLPVLVHRFQVQTALNFLRTNDTVSDIGEGAKILRAIAQFRSKLALHSLLRCLNGADQIRTFGEERVVPFIVPRVVRGPQTSYTLRDLVQNLLSKNPTVVIDREVDFIPNTGTLEVVQRTPRQLDESAETWQPILEQYPIEELALRDRELIRHALATYREEND
jgi:hypothetical protein